MTSLGLQARVSNCPGVSRVLQGLVLDAPSIGKSPPPCTLTCIIHWLLSPALSRPQKRWLLSTIDFQEPHHRWSQKRKRIWILRVPVVFGRWLCLPTFWRADPEKQGIHLNTKGRRDLRICYARWGKFPERKILAKQKRGHQLFKAIYY